jgi:hypothetical protein
VKDDAALGVCRGVLLGAFCTAMFIEMILGMPVLKAVLKFLFSTVLKAI